MTIEVRVIAEVDIEDFRKALDSVAKEKHSGSLGIGVVSDYRGRGVGFQTEGVMKNYMLIDGTLYNALIMSLLNYAPKRRWRRE